MESIGATMKQGTGKLRDLPLLAGETSPEDFPAHAGRKSVLICGAQEPNDKAGANRMAALAHAVGLRLLDIAPVNEAAAHMDAMITVPDAVIVCCAGDDPGAEDLLPRLGGMASAGELALVVITDFGGLDLVHDSLASDRPVILCDPSAEEMVAAVAALAEHQDGGHHLHDIGAEAEADRFERLNDQLLRLNRMIEALVQDRTQEDSYLRPWGDVAEAAVQSPRRGYKSGQAESMVGNPEPISAQQVRAMLRVRRLREHIVAPDLFADPAWDIMLDLLAARLEKANVSVSSLCIAAAVPPTTALRWIRHLTDRRLLERQADPNDGRRIFIALSDEGMDAVVRWFHESRAHLLSALGLTEDDGWRKGT